MVYPHKWPPISCRSSAGQGKFAGQRPTLYHYATQPVCELHWLIAGLLYWTAIEALLYNARTVVWSTPNRVRVRALTVYPPHMELSFSSSETNPRHVCFWTTICIHRVKWRRSNLWSQCDLYVVGQHGVLCKVVSIGRVIRIKLNQLV